MPHIIKRGITRETAVMDERTRRKIMLRLDAHPHVVRLRLKGTRQEYVVPIKEIYLLGARIRAQELKEEKKQKKRERARLLGRG